MIEIPDQTESITLTQEEYPDLPFKEVVIGNPRKLREGLARYYEYMLKKYDNGRFTVSRK